MMLHILSIKINTNDNVHIALSRETELVAPLIANTSNAENGLMVAQIVFCISLDKYTPDANSDKTVAKATNLLRSIREMKFVKTMRNEKFATINISSLP